MKCIPLFAIGTSIAMIQYAGATDYQYGTTTGNFSTGFTPTLSNGLSTTSDRLVFTGANVTYTATDDLTGITSNQVVYNPTSTAAQTVTVARGAGDNLVTLGGANPVLNFANTAQTGVVDNLDYAYAANGYITKSANLAIAAANPIMNGAVSLGGNSLTIALTDTANDVLPELRMNGAITGSGNLILNNNGPSLPLGIGAPGTNESWGTLLVTGNNASFTGPVTIAKGRLVVNNDNALGTGVITVVGTGTNTDDAGVLALGGNNGGPVPAYGGIVAPATGITLPNNINLGGQVGGGAAKYGIGLYSNTGLNTLNGLTTLTQATANIQVNSSTLTMNGGLTDTGAARSIVKSGGGTLNINNGDFSGTASIVNNGNVAFTGTILPGGTLAVNSPGSLNASGAYPTLSSWISSGRLAAASTGQLALTGTSTEAVSFQGFPTLGLGATAAGADYSGALTPDNTTNRYRIGGGGGTLTLSGTNTLTGANAVEFRNGPVVLAGSNNYTGVTTIGGGSTVTLGAAGALGTAGQISMTGGTLRFTAANTTDYSARLGIGAAGQNYIFDTNGQNVTFATAFGSFGSNLTRTGAGKLTLGGSSQVYQPIGHVNNINGGELEIGAGCSLLVAATAAPNPVQDGVFNNNGNSTVTVGTGSQLTISGGFITNTGTINTTGGIDVGGEFQMGQGAGVTATMTVGAGANVIARNWFPVGRGGGNGTLNITGGTVTRQGTAGTAMMIGSGEGAANCVGTLNMSGGALNINDGREFWIAQGQNRTTERTQGTVNLSGGTITCNSWLAVGREGGYGTVNITGGNLIKQGANHTELGQASASVGTVTVSAGSFIANNEVRLGGSDGGAGTITVTDTGLVDLDVLVMGNGGVSTATVNLNTGGLLQVNRIRQQNAAAIGNLNFNGGTLSAKSTRVDFLEGIDSAKIESGGAIIDTNFSDVTIAQNLVAGTGNGGLTKLNAGTLTLTGTGTNYTGNTVVDDGVLSLPAAFLADTSTVSINLGQLNLNYTGDDTVAGLILNGTPASPGFHDASTDPTYITGTGRLFVSGAGPTGYDAFKANPANNLTTGVNDGATQDPDGDGIPNILEFVFGGLPNGAGASNRSILPTQSQTATDLIVTFKRADASEGDLTLKVQWSADLVTWGTPKEIAIGATSSGIVSIAEDTPSGDFDTVTVTIPKTGNEVGQKLFARVSVVR